MVATWACAVDRSAGAANSTRSQPALLRVSSHDANLSHGATSHLGAAALDVADGFRRHAAPSLLLRRREAFTDSTTARRRAFFSGDATPGLLDITLGCFRPELRIDGRNTPRPSPAARGLLLRRRWAIFSDGARPSSPVTRRWASSTSRSATSGRSRRAS